MVRAARRPGEVRVAPAARERVAASYAFAETVAAQRSVYGRSTGVGSNRDQAVTASAERALQLLRSHATSSGERRAPERVRAMLLVRLNQLAADGSGLHPRVLDALAGMVSADALPPVREGGSVGTADLAALATTALVLTGERTSVPAVPATVGFDAGDALTFMSSNAAVLGDAALAVADLRRLVRASVVVAALAFHAVRGNVEAFGEAVEVATPFPGRSPSAGPCACSRGPRPSRRGSRTPSACGPSRRCTARSSTGSASPSTSS